MADISEEVETFVHKYICPKRKVLHLPFWDLREFISKNKFHLSSQSPVSARSRHMLMLHRHLVAFIKNDQIGFPNVIDFEGSVPVEKLIQNESMAQITCSPYVNRLPDYIKQNKFLKMYGGKELMLISHPKDYERLDIMTDYFTGDARNSSFIKNKISPKVTFKKFSHRIVENALDYVFEKKCDLTSKVLYDSMYRLKIRECKNFKVSVAMAIYDFFEPSLVYDPCAGWGDRAIGAILSKSIIKYVGTDPNPKLKKGYQEIRDFFQIHRPEKKLLFLDLPAEDVPLKKIFSEEQPDMIFTSPPFFDFEIYDDNVETKESQSIFRYPEVEDWTNNWLIAMTHKNWIFLRPGGHLIYYFSNISKEYDMVQKLISEMNCLPDCVYEGQIPVTILKYSSRKIEDEKEYRPVFLYIWEKKK